MDLKVDEQILLANFRRLPTSRQKELLDFATLLVRKSLEPEPERGETRQTAGSCELQRPAERPETAKEPIFTE